MIILASASPRRQELLKLVVPQFKVVSADIDESFTNNMKSEDIVKELAMRKAAAALKLYPKDIIIGSDTLVTVDGNILGKPRDKQDAARMLKMLSNKWHNVDTGVCVMSENKCESFSVSTDVKFVELDENEIIEYIKSGEPMDKAGAYGIQEKGAKFVSEIRGDYYSVMGLPVSRLYQTLREKWSYDII